MKKTLAMVLCLSMMLSVLAGCGNSGGSAPASSQSNAPASSAASGSAPEAPAEEAITLKMGSTSPVGTFHETIANTFAQKANEVSGGLITVNVNMGGVLGNTLSHYSQMAQGDLDFFMAALDTSSGLKEGGDMAVVLVPFLFDDETHYNKFLESDLLGGMVGKIESANGLKYLGALSRQMPRGLSTTNTPVRSVADVKNLKIRTPEATAMTTIWSAWGANPTIISGGEMYSALQSGLADGQDNDVINTSTSALYEIQKYYMELNYIYQNLFLWASAKTFGELSEQQQAWINEAVAATYAAMDQELNSMYETEKQKMIDNGMEFIDADLDSFREATEAAVGEFEGTLYTAGLYDEIRALAG
ncbi:MULTISPECIES: TRAP transporter substrate-binding protein [Anaerotruncus]|uniref:TRAP transporter substrate-binding protein n=2 Tax=Oscillospiraceae TaxID=216572 RepID=UPI00082D54B3|nr:MULTISPECIES: TRAP transporter substrate-binding protein [Anaerotruncus]